MKKTWHFVPELSNGTLEDYVTTLNVPVVASQESKRGDYWTSLMLDAVYSSISATLFVNKTVGELLFEGYEDTLLSIAELSGAKTFAPMDKFGFFYKVKPKDHYRIKVIVKHVSEQLFSMGREKKARTESGH